MISSKTNTIWVLDPTALPRDARGGVAPRLPSLRGRAIGFLWNSKPNGDILFAELEGSLRRDYAIASAVLASKERSSIGATEDLIAGLSSRVSAVIVGIGD
ncbi:MAG: hypothetical protein HY681_09545 [Chloroflexi bacterium]|nr:hypothetical protein [Chloroflexota bacterium]